MIGQEDKLKINILYPLHVFITGNAAYCKCFLTKVLYQSLTKTFSTPTKVASLNTDGATIQLFRSLLVVLGKICQV